MFHSNVALEKKNNLDLQDVTKYKGMDNYFKIIPERSLPHHFYHFLKSRNSDDLKLTSYIR